MQDDDVKIETDHLIDLTKEQIFSRYIDLLKSYDTFKVHANRQLEGAQLDIEALEEEVKMSKYSNWQHLITVLLHRLLR